MRISQPDNVAGDGKRIPAIEPEATQVTALVVLVNGESDAVSVAQTDKLHAIATELPDAWRLATWDRSHMTTDLVLQNN